jgi:hypothetical protein
MSLHFFANWPYRGVCGGDKAKVPNCHLTCDVNSAMTDSQANIVHLYNVFSVVGLVIMILCLLKVLMSKYIGRLMWGECFVSRQSVSPQFFSPRDSSAITLRSINNARAYVPTVRRALLSKSLLITNLSEIPIPYNYCAKALGPARVNYEPLSLAKLNFSNKVKTAVTRACGQVTHFNSPGSASDVLEMCIF